MTNSLYSLHFPMNYVNIFIYVFYLFLSSFFSNSIFFPNTKYLNFTIFLSFIKVIFLFVLVFFLQIIDLYLYNIIIIWQWYIILEKLKCFEKINSYEKLLLLNINSIRLMFQWFNWHNFKISLIWLEKGLQVFFFLRKGSISTSI